MRIAGGAGSVGIVGSAGRKGQDCQKKKKTKEGRVGRIGSRIPCITVDGNVKGVGAYISSLNGPCISVKSSGGCGGQEG